MNPVARNLVLQVVLPVVVAAQNPSCPGPLVYMDGGSFVRVYNPQAALSSVNPSNTSIPAFGSGLALMPSLNGGSVCPTFYTTSNGVYYYWNGSSWVSTGHSTGNSTAVNLAGCSSRLYNLVGTSGDIYVYDGSGNGTYLTTLSGFSGGGPFDLSVDCNCNFYALKTTTTGAGQQLTLYSSAGSPMVSYSLINMPHTSGGMGLAVTGNTVFVKNGAGTGFFAGIISGGAVTFTQVTGFSLFPGDFASCPSCSVAPPPLSATVTGGTITCSNPTVQLSVSTTVSPVTFSWSGPSISGASTSSAVTVNAPGQYTCVAVPQACGVTQNTFFVAAGINTTPVSFTLSPAGNVCTEPNSSNVLSVSQPQQDETVDWTGPGIGTISGTASISVTGPGSFSVTVTNTANGCSASDAVHFAETPTMTVLLSSQTVCANGFAGSPASLTIAASGASSYTYFTDGLFGVNSPNSGTTLAVPSASQAATANGTVMGSNSFCSDTAYFSFVILQNPSVSVNSGSVCPGQSLALTASGPGSFTWSSGGPIAINTASILVSPTVTKNYLVTSEVNGCLSLPAVAVVSVMPVPLVSVASGSVTVCSGNSGTLIAIGNAQSYTWSPATALNASVGVMVVASPAASQGYTVTGSLNGCTSAAALTVGVQSPPSLALSLNSNAMCYYGFFGSPNAITVTASGANSYSLMPSPSFSSLFAGGSSHVVVPAGPLPQQVITVTATLLGQAAGCVGSKSFTFNVIPNPTVTITPPVSSVCPGGAQVVHLSGADAYSWMPSPFVSTLAAASGTFKPVVPGFFGARGFSLGCSSDIRNAVIHIKPLPQLNVSPAASTVCAGTPVILQAKGNATSFTWSPQSQLLSAYDRSVTATPMLTQQFTVVGSLNSCTREAVATVTAVAVPIVNAAAQPSAVCAGNRVKLNASGATTYSWDPLPSLESSTGEMVTALPGSNTTYTVRGYNGSCSGSATAVVRTVQPPQVSVISENGKNTICYGDSLSLIASGAFLYSWIPANIIVDKPAPDRIRIKPSKSTTVTVSGINQELGISCTHLATFPVTVIPQAEPRVSGTFSVCRGAHTRLLASGGNTFRWNPAGGQNAVFGPEIIVAPEETTEFIVEVSNDGACGSYTSITVDVMPLPEIFAGNDTIWNINDAIVLSARGTGSLSWTEGENIMCPSCAETAVSPHRSGCYTARAVSENGCLSYDEVCLQLTDEFSLYMPSSFSPNGDGLNDLFTVFGENIGEMTLEIFDRWGHVMHRTHDGDAGWDGSWQGKPCIPGIYVYKLTYEGIDRKTYNRTGHITLVR